MSYPKLHQIKHQLLLDLGKDATDEQIQTEYNSRKSTHDSQLLKNAAKRRYHEDIYNEMLLVFGTTNTDTIQANFEENRLRVAKPELFNDSVDAQAELDKAEAYLVYRNNRYKEYKNELESI